MNKIFENKFNYNKLRAQLTPECKPLYQLQQELDSRVHTVPSQVPFYGVSAKDETAALWVLFFIKSVPVVSR